MNIFSSELLRIVFFLLASFTNLMAVTVYVWLRYYLVRGDLVVAYFKYRFQRLFLRSDEGRKKNYVTCMSLTVTLETDSVSPECVSFLSLTEIDIRVVI
jgi:hypothetical protein